MYLFLKRSEATLRVTVAVVQYNAFAAFGNMRFSMFHVLLPRVYNKNRRTCEADGVKVLEMCVWQGKG